MTPMRHLLRWTWSSTWGMVISAVTLGAAHAAPAAADHDLRYWQALGHTHYIQEGSKGAVIYDFIDPNCPYCHQIYTWLRNPIDNGGLRVRFIIVGFLTPSSEGKAAAILSAADPVQALQENEVQFSMQRSGPQGGIAPASPQRVEKMRGVLHFNKSLLEGKEFQLEGAPVVSVPLLVYRQGNAIHYLSGLPDNAQWKALLDAS